jgi:O-antigen ligase
MTWSLAPLRHWSARFGAAIASLGCLVILVSLFRVPDVPWILSLALLASAAGSAFRPDLALVAIAVAIPVASWLGRFWNGTVAWPEVLAVAFSTGYCARSALGRHRAAHPADPLAGPVLLTAAIVLGSLAVQLWIDVWRFGAASVGRDLSDLISANYFVLTMSGDPIDAAMRVLVSLVLLKAAATEVQRKPKLAAQLLTWAVGGAAVAAIVNVARVWQAASRLESPLRSFFSYVMNVRLNVHYADLNAAGSYFVLLFFPALGLALARKRRIYWVAVLLIAGGIWISGSRTAIAVALLAMVVPAAALGSRMRQDRGRWLAIAGATLALVIVAAAVAHFSPTRGNQQSALAAIQVRVEMIRTSLRMTASSPWFGVGIGRYYFRSGEFSSPELLRLFPPAIHENAHNNFLQFLAELGIVGFGAVLWLLWTAARLCASLVARERLNAVAWGLVTGLIAFVLSWLGGHPLLIDEPAFAFWLLVGVACGWATVVAPPSPVKAHTTWVVGILVAIVAVSIPWQVVQQRANSELEHRGVGLSPHWHPGVDGVRYRLAGPISSVFVPSAAQSLVIPLRTVSEVPQLRVEIRLDDRPADVVTVTNDRWHYLRLHMMRDRNPPRFRRLELRAAEASGDSPVLMIGKVEPR